MAKSTQIQIKFIYETVQPKPFDPDDNGLVELLRSEKQSELQPKQPGPQLPNRVRRRKHD